MTDIELKVILELHDKWLKDIDVCKCADLRGANLRGANLEGANLRGANLEGGEGNMSFEIEKLKEVNYTEIELHCCGNCRHVFSDLPHVVVCVELKSNVNFLGICDKYE